MLPGTPHFILFTFYLRLLLKNGRPYRFPCDPGAQNMYSVLVLRLAAMAIALGTQARRRTIFLLFSYNIKLVKKRYKYPDVKTIRSLRKSNWDSLPTRKALKRRVSVLFCYGDGGSRRVWEAFKPGNYAVSDNVETHVGTLFQKRRCICTFF